MNFKTSVKWLLLALATVAVQADASQGTRIPSPDVQVAQGTRIPSPDVQVAQGTRIPSPDLQGTRIPSPDVA
jgi:hypothetical protein